LDLPFQDTLVAIDAAIAAIEALGRSPRHAKHVGTLKELRVFLVENADLVKNAERSRIS
jgi:hypothetical protein